MLKDVIFPFLNNPFCFHLLSIAVDCGLPQPLHNGSLSGNSTVFPGIMRLACDAGFILRGEPVVRCQANGTWSRPGSFCEGLF